MRRERWIALILLSALLLAGDYIYWRAAVGQTREAFDAWTAQAQTAGFTIQHGAMATAGWPSAAELRIRDVSINAFGGRAAVGGWSWSTGEVLLRARLIRPDILEILLLEPRPIQLHDSQPVPVSADGLRLRLSMRPNAPPRAVDIDAVSLTATVPGLGQIGVGQFTLHADLTLDAGRDEAAVTFAASASPVSLPDSMHSGLGPEIATAMAEGVLNGPLFLTRPSSTPASAARPSPVRNLAESATSWRDGGGSLGLHRLLVVWGPARLEATATLALDEDLQPMGVGTSKIAGYGAALDALAANAVLSRSASKAAKAVLSLLASTPASGQPEEVEVPLTLQYRTLSVHQVPLLRFPELDWPRH